MEGVGIDFGTGTSAIALVREPGALPRFIKPYPHKDGLLYVESAVAYDPTIGRVVTGRRAQRLSIVDLQEGRPACFPIKPKMGKGEKFRLANDTVSPQELAAYIIARLVRRAASQEVIPIDVILSAPAVITYPADADEAQRQATLEAAKLVGFTNIYGMAEPHAAAYTYVMHNREYLVETHKKQITAVKRRREELEMDARAKPAAKAALTKEVEQKQKEFESALSAFYKRMDGRPFLVYDFGAGTFDAVVGELRVDPTGTLVFNVLGRDGRKRVGGHYVSLDFSRAVVKRFTAENKGMPSLDAATEYQIFEHVDAKKIELSDELQVDLFTKVQIGDDALTLDQKWDRLRFKSDVLDQTLDQTIEVCQNAVREAVERSGRLTTADDIRNIFLVGGSSRIPFVKQKLQESFKKSKITDLRNLTWDVVAAGAVADIGPASAIVEEMGDPITAVVGGAAIAAAKYAEAERTGESEGRTFLEALGVTSRSNFSLWWNTGGDTSPRYELICDRGEVLPYLFKEQDIWPQNPRARVIAWSIWQSTAVAEELRLEGFPQARMTPIGRIQLRQQIGDEPRPIHMTIRIEDNGDIHVEATQGTGERFEERARLPSVFAPAAGLTPEEFEDARKRIQQYMNADEVR